MQNQMNLNEKALKPRLSWKETILLLLSVCPIFLTACSSVPHEKLVPVPEYLQIQEPPQPSPAHPFLERMENFLQGKLPKQN